MGSSDHIPLPPCHHCCRGRKPHLQGRFSGRLATKDDEKRLTVECRLLGPLLGGVGKRGDSSRLTLAKIVRGIASGEVRKFCEERERAFKGLRQRLAHLEGLAAELAGARAEAAQLRDRISELEATVRSSAGLSAGLTRTLQTVVVWELWSWGYGRSHLPVCLSAWLHACHPVP
jgi:hypothetical protein